MGTGNLIGQPLEAKAIAAVIGELERQAAKAPDKLSA